MPNGPHRITGLPFEEELYKSEHTIEDAEIQVKHVIIEDSITTQQCYGSGIFVPDPDLTIFFIPDLTIFFYPGSDHVLSRIRILQKKEGGKINIFFKHY
jgi:hypothetical protein